MGARVRRLLILVTIILALVVLVPSGIAPTVAQSQLDSIGAAPPALQHMQPGRPRTVLPVTTDAENVELVGHIGGPTYAVAVQGNYAYVGEGYSLTIVDISSPASPTIAGKTTPLPDQVQDVCVAGDYAYVADGDGGLRIVDISITFNPTEVGFYDTPGWAEDVAIAGDRAFVVDGDLHIVDISDPAAPTQESFYDTPVSALSVTIAGSYAYLADHDGLRVMDVSDLGNPTEVGFYDTPGWAEGVAVVGDYAYITVFYAGLWVADVSTPANPRGVGSYDTPGHEIGLSVVGGYAYVAAWKGGLRVMDVSDAADPTEVGYYDTPGCAYAVAVARGCAYVADGNGGLLILRFTGLHDTGFRPDPDGYSFSNSDSEWGVYPRPPAVYDFTTADMRKMFGDDCVCHMVGSVCFVKWHAIRWNDLANRLMSHTGHCTGMAVTSLRLFKGIGDEDENEPCDFQAGADVTYDLQLSSGRRYVSYNWMTQLTNPTNTDTEEHLQRTPSQVLDDLLSASWRGATDPMVLAVYNEDRTKGHTITPFFIQYQGNGVYWVRVYDNNDDPGDFTRYLTIDTINDTWSSNLSGEPGTWSGGADSHNLGAVPITVYAQRPVCPEWDEAADQLSEWLTGPGHLLITDSGGRRIGFVGSQFVNEIPGASSYAPPGGLGTPAEPIYTLPLTETYTILLDGQTLTQTETVAFTQFGPGYAVSVDNVALEQQSQDEIAIALDGTRLVYGAEGSREVTLSLALDGLHESSQLQVKNADIGEGQVVTLTADVSNGHLVFDNRQTGGGEYSLDLRRIGTAGEQWFVHAGVDILAGDTHCADYGAWDGSGAMTLHIDHGSDGTVDETLVLENNVRIVYLPLILRAR